MSLHDFSAYPSLTDAVFSDRFNRIDRLFSQLTGDLPVSFKPPYDIRQMDENRFALSLSVPGWKEHELEIEVTGGRLTIVGKKEVKFDDNRSAEETQGGWLHKGISRTDFCLNYAIPEHMKVTDASLEDGILTVGLHQELLESQKPQRIPIHQKAPEALEQKNG
ncbi:Hsp20 family protein [Franconibacter pulveris 1160]|uniref:SHSP domain-containing protein n=2 Tax=Franconibacter TaxID=1649295 RepID=A0A0J8VPJ8_9ENTR|nr:MULTISPECIES: Hsp20 family protein [Franconibacter]KMV34872.1 hypothetical protein ACH50_08905 [Franconibacter pulveris]MCK1967937.1 Hsp20 family protein [Franconibacter sp. IITDAS19]MEB5920592.1 Hsp20 family protein [Franconibacter daqui]GGD15645.1 heat shock protein [Franconibacter daqui]